MPYILYLSRLRWTLQQPWMGSARCSAIEAAACSAHSAKVSFLFFARRTGEAEDGEGESVQSVGTVLTRDHGEK